MRVLCVCVSCGLVTLTSRFWKHASFTLQAMGGHVSPVLSEMVTVVVALDLTSDKCKIALKRAAEHSQEICVVYPSWLDDCVQHQRRLDPKVCDECNKRHPDHATQAAAANHTCEGHCKYLIPVLTKGEGRRCVRDCVSTTGFSLSERNAIQAKVELLGARFDKQLDENCTVCVCVCVFV